MTHLLDTGISECTPRNPSRPFLTSVSVSLTGHVIDCPQSLSTGCTILLNIKVYLTREAFEKVEKDGREGEGSFWQEQKETTEEEAMRKRKDALGALFSKQLAKLYMAQRKSDHGMLAGRIGVTALRSNALLLAQKKNGAAVIDEKSLQHFESPSRPSSASGKKRSPSPTKSNATSTDKGKGRASAANSDDEEEDSGDEAEKLDDQQLNEIDTIYRK